MHCIPTNIISRRAVLADFNECLPACLCVCPTFVRSAASYFLMPPDFAIVGASAARYGRYEGGREDWDRGRQTRPFLMSAPLVSPLLLQPRTLCFLPSWHFVFRWFWRTDEPRGGTDAIKLNIRLSAPFKGILKYQCNYHPPSSKMSSRNSGRGRKEPLSFLVSRRRLQLRNPRW